MKKVFLSALLIAGLGSVFTACNNGDYDAIPEASDATILNPLNPESGVTIPIGYIRANLNGYQADFISGGWTDTVPGTAIIYATRVDNPTQWQTIAITLTNYNGAGTYTLGPDGSGGTISHLLINPLDNNYISLGFMTAIGAGSATVVVEGTEDGNLRGKFSGALYQYAPVINTGNEELITEGMFYVRKQ